MNLTSALVPSVSLFFCICKKTVAAPPLGGVSMNILCKWQSPTWSAGQAALSPACSREAETRQAGARGSGRDGERPRFLVSRAGSGPGRPRTRCVPLSAGLQVTPAKDARQGQLWKGNQLLKDGVRGVNRTWRAQERHRVSVECYLGQVIQVIFIPLGLGLFLKDGWLRKGKQYVWHIVGTQ